MVEARSCKVALILVMLNVALFPFLLEGFMGGVEAQVATQPRGVYRYVFDVDDDGVTKVFIDFHHETAGQGFSWFLVPRDLDSWTYRVASGSVVAFNITDVHILELRESVFYSNFTFTYAPSNNFFKIEAEFTITYGALIVEPIGFFYSSPIGYPSDSKAYVLCVLPAGSSTSRDKVKVYPGEGATVTIMKRDDGRVEVRVENPRKLARIAVEYTAPPRVREEVTIRRGKFYSLTVKRYAWLAERFISLFAESEPILTDVFSIKLDSVKLNLFAPTLRQFELGIGGIYSPGLIQVNLFFIREVAGYVEIIALHEFVHHLLWNIGVPISRLWFHEGAAEYFSIETAKLIGYGEGARKHEDRLMRIVNWLHGQYGFVATWTQGFVPAGRSVAECYAASYAVFKFLGDSYGGFAFYKRFFKLFKEAGPRMGDDTVIVHYLSLAANTSLADRFVMWGFYIIDLTRLSRQISEASKLIQEINPLLQPSKILAEQALRRARQAFELGRYEESLKQVRFALFLATYAIPITIITYVTVIAFLLTAYKISRRKREAREVKVMQQEETCPACGKRILATMPFCPYCGRRKDSMLFSL